MNVKDLVKVLNGEVDFHRKQMADECDTAESFGALKGLLSSEYKKGFIKGLNQAIDIIKEMDSIERTGRTL